MQTDISILAAQPFLRGMSTQQLELLAGNSVPAEFRAGERIFNEGAPANRFYLILGGQVELESPVLDDGAVHIQTLGAGDLLGCSWLLPPYFWQFNAWAVTPTKGICFHGTHLRELCETNRDFGYELMKRVSEILLKRMQAMRRELLEHSRQGDDYQ
jgi:CRP/FNR family transcriptional regulator, cyclic AMP receptor protein